eukprot:173835_1
MALMGDEPQNRNGLIEWKITGNLLERIKSATHTRTSFGSPEFQTPDGTIWRLKFYPVDKASQDRCAIRLQCCRLNVKKQRIGVNVSFNIAEVNWIEEGFGYTFENEERTGWKAFKNEELKSLDALNIKCFIEETMDVTDTNTYYEWNVSNYWFKNWKTAKRARVFVSPRFNVMGQKWGLAICPNGKDEEGTASLGIVCPFNESEDEKEINVCHYIGIDALNYYQIKFEGTAINKDNKYIKCVSPFQLPGIQNLSGITICVKIWDKGSIDNDEVRLLSNLYSEKMVKQQQKHLDQITTVEQELQLLRNKYEKRKSKAQTTRTVHMEAMRSLDELTQSLQTDNKRLQSENSELREECKESKLELIRVKKELRKARNYLEWRDSEVVDWVVSLQNGEYAQYEESLRLLFSKENVNGVQLSEISKSDLKDWGIQSLSQRSNLYQEIQKLINT